jgi:CRISPR-associated protein Cmr3
MARTYELRLEARDPLIVRDARPFGAGSRMKSLDWPRPSLLAGAVRSLLGKEAGGSFDEKTVSILKEIEVAGPLPLVGRDLFLPAPGDFVAEKGSSPGGEISSLDRLGRSYALRPEIPAEGEGTNLPEGLRPLVLRGLSGESEDFKPARIPSFWRRDRVVAWLLDARGESFRAAGSGRKDPRSELGGGDCLSGIPHDERVHVCIDPETGTARDGMIYTTTGLDFSASPLSGVSSPAERAASEKRTSDGVLPGDADVRMIGRIREGQRSISGLSLAGLDRLGTFGGERRFARFRIEEEKNGIVGWSCPETIRRVLEGIPVSGAATSGESSPGVRMLLATEGIFKAGWCPGWLHPLGEKAEQRFEGTPPGLPEGEIVLRLVGASVDRRRPVSGWNYDCTGGRRPGPKATRWSVPAGSVYFFRVVRGKPGSLASLWLESACDEEQDRRDGFGLALWGSYE